jgi:uncharacterized protein
MSNRLPEFIAPLRLAELGRVLRGRLPLSRFRRLAQSLSAADGEAEVVLEFGADEQGRPQVTGTVKAELELPCQRCLEPMTLPVVAEIRLALASSEAEEEQLAPGFEALPVGDGSVSVADIVEDELILALPLVPMHAQTQCGAVKKYALDVSEGVLAPESPFAVLAGLKKGREE